MKLKLFLFLLPVVAFAGAGVNGGSGGTLDQLTLDLLYGTFSLGGSSFDYLATNVPLIIDDDGHDLLTSIDLTSSLDSRIYSGITALLATGSMPVTLTAPFSTCTPSPCTPAPDGTTTFSTTAPTDNIAFSTGGLGEITDVTNASQIMAEAETLNLITAGSLSLSTPEGSLTFTVTSTEGLPEVITTVTDYTINLEELDFNGTAPAGAAVPEPSSFVPAFVCLVIFALARINRFGEAARRMAGPARVSRRFPS